MDYLQTAAEKYTPLGGYVSLVIECGIYAAIPNDGTALQRSAKQYGARTAGKIVSIQSLGSNRKMTAQAYMTLAPVFSIPWQNDRYPP